MTPSDAYRLRSRLTEARDTSCGPASIWRLRYAQDVADLLAEIERLWAERQQREAAERAGEVEREMERRRQEEEEARRRAA
jgi:hypothetical protein